MRLRALSNVLINLSRSRPSIVFYDLLGVNSEAYSPLSLTIPLLLGDSSYIESSILRVSTSPNDPVAADSLSSSTMFSGALHKLCEQIRMYDLDGGY